ncbi:Fur family ferric uptake transcriptional regulator [Actinomycetospora cinnamomea]|uniref:Fur family ferric uptake transcriptional regulator n=1 Tax=Actinomycetospora cinnamomea TaxID=663609 RepID=A0A2U1ECP3_9PSEU|nr:Fur family ferric uptake transcriptional regulator [Actinomycetospora cinnamomea]
MRPASDAEHPIVGTGAARRTERHPHTLGWTHPPDGAHARHHPASPAPTIGEVDTELRQTLHRRGLRMTPQRQLVLDAVTELGHATPEAVCTRVQETAPAVNITTVYRTLDLLEQLGVVRHTHLGHGAPTYATAGHEHVHLVCHHCGAVDEIEVDALDQLAEALHASRGFRLDATHVALSGTCRACAERADAELTVDTEDTP